MHEPAGVVEILVQILKFWQNTPYSEVQNTPPPEKKNWKNFRFQTLE